MPALTQAPNTPQRHWTDEHASPEAEAHARAVLGDAQGYPGCSPPQPTHHGRHPTYHGQHPMYPDSQQALSSPAVNSRADVFTASVFTASVFTASVFTASPLPASRAAAGRGARAMLGDGLHGHL